MASFQKRGKTWQYTISRMVDGKSDPVRKGGFNTKKEAAVAAAEIESQLHKGYVPNLKPIPFCDYFESWLKLNKKAINNNTRARYLNTLETIKTYFSLKPIQDINKREYQEFLNEYATTHAKDTTKKLNTHIRACVRYAIDEEIIRKDFTREAVVTGNRKAKRPEEKHLDYADSLALKNELFKRLDDGLIYYLLLLALTSGMRFAEIIGLTRKDFDFVNSKITIDKTWGYTKRMHNGFGETKNEQSIRTIKMDKKTMKAFDKLFQTTPENIHKLVFYSQASKYRVYSNGAANKALNNILKKLYIEPISVHGLRHTHASVLLYKRVSVYYVSERLGHKDIQTTNQYYAHVIKELREEDEKTAIEIWAV